MAHGHEMNRLYRRLLAKLAKGSIDLKKLRIVRFFLRSPNVDDNCCLVLVSLSCR